MIHPKCLPNQAESEDGPKYVDFEIICPMCRHYSNILLPCWKNSASEEKVKSTSLVNLADMIANAKFESAISAANDYVVSTTENMEERENRVVTTSENIFEFLCQQYTSIGVNNPIAEDVAKENDFLGGETMTSADYMIFIVNRLKEIIESEVVTADYEVASNHKPPFLQLFESFQVQWRRDLSESSSKFDYRNQLAQIVIFLSTQGHVQDVPGVPLMLRDYFVLMLELMLTLYPISKEQMTQLVKMVYNLSYISSLVRICSDMTPSEIAIWKSVSPLSEDTKSMADIVYRILESMEVYHLVAVAPTTDPIQLSANGGMREKMVTRVETKATQMLMQFVKPTSLMVNHFFPQCPLPNEGVGPKADLGLLCNYLGNRIL